MRKLIALAVVAALVVPATADAAKAKKYAGYFGASPAEGTVAFKVKKTKRGKKVVRFRFDTLAISCDSGAQTTSGILTFPVKVKKNKTFATTAVLGPPRNPIAKLRVKGKVKPGKNASGTMRVFGSEVPIDAGGADACNSGLLTWQARVGGLQS